MVIAFTYLILYTGFHLMGRFFYENMDFSEVIKFTDKLMIKAADNLRVKSEATIR